jgi:hypothetical protein
LALEIATLLLSTNCAVGNSPADPRVEHRQPRCGERRGIHGELLKLGVEIGQTSVAKYMAKRVEIPCYARKIP